MEKVGEFPVDMGTLETYDSTGNYAFTPAWDSGTQAGVIFMGTAIGVAQIYSDPL